MYEINPQRFVSLLTRKTLALVLAGGRGSRLYELTAWRAKPAVFFGGKFRIIDFALSNAINSGIRRIGVLTQYKAHSLVRHISEGWGGFKRVLHEFVEVLPASQRIDTDWYRGTADAIYQNLDIINTHNPEFVLILSGDHVYKMDYGAMLAFHSEQQSDLTILCVELPVSEAAATFGVIEVDENGRVIGFEEKPAHPRPLPGQPDMCLASMGNYVLPAQPIDATHALKRSAGVSNPRVFVAVHLTDAPPHSASPESVPTSRFLWESTVSASHSYSRLNPAARDSAGRRSTPLCPSPG